jgi:mutator protein MutT
MELLDIYDNSGNVTGKTIIRGDKTAILGENEHIAIAVIFIESSDGKFLIQKTSKEKGGEFSSTGGHVNSGETPLEAIKREVKEELGIDIDDENIEEYGFLSFDMPLRYLFYINKDINIEDIKIQKEEVDYVKYMSIEEIEKLIKNNQMLKSHGIMFNKLLIKRKI